MKTGTSGAGLPPYSLPPSEGSQGTRNTTPLIYGRDGNHYILVASRSGAPRNPGWYRNLSKTPDVEIQIKTCHVPARARTATPEEKPALWSIMANIWPPFLEYQSRTDRDIPVVVLEVKG